MKVEFKHINDDLFLKDKTLNIENMKLKSLKIEVMCGWN